MPRDYVLYQAEQEKIVRSGSEIGTVQVLPDYAKTRRIPRSEIEHSKEGGGLSPSLFVVYCECRM